MPTLSDGSLDREQSLRFIAGNTSGYAGGWSAQSRHGKASLAERAAKLLGIKNEFETFDFSDLANSDNQDSQAGKQPADGEDREKKFFYDYGHASGMAYLARCLRDAGRLESLRDIAVEATGITPEQAMKAARLFAYMANAWIVDLLGETLGKKYAKEFDQELAGWVKGLKAKTKKRGTAK
jgi:hypothetical protein